MTGTTKAEKLRQYKIRFSLIAEQILAFVSYPNMIREVKNLPPNFKKMRDNILRYSIFSFG